MHVIGLLGGVASGKSWVARAFARLGAVVLDADQAGHRALECTEVKQALREHWGEGIFRVDGEIDRAAVAKLVFEPTNHGRKELAFLEEVTHPRIATALRTRIDHLAANGAPAAILDAPVLLKAGWNRFCTHLVYVDAPRDVRLARARQRSWTEQEFDDREAAQEPLSVKRAQADAVIENTGDDATTLAQIAAVWQSLAVNTNAKLPE